MEKVFIGTYTKNKALSEFVFNKGNLTHIKTYKNLQYCSYLQFKNNTLYALNENDKWDNGYLIILNNYSIQKKDSYGINPCHINVGKYITICNYSSNSVCIYDNNQQKCTFYIKNSLPHCAIEYNKEIIVVDKNDRLLLINSNMQLNCLHKFKSGTEPRHIIMYDNIFYIISEKTNELFIFKDYKFIDSIKIADGIGCAIKIYNNYLFTTAKGTNEIHVFNIENKIKPILIQTISSYGKNPRDMDFFDNYLLVCNVDSNNISIFTFEKMLKYNSSFYVKKPFCICFKR